MIALNRCGRAFAITKARSVREPIISLHVLDSIIDGFFPVLEAYGRRFLEEEVVANPTRRTLYKIYQARRELLALRRAIWPQRDAINSDPRRQ